MALKYTGDAIIKVGLSVKTPKPIDDRLVVQTRADLFAINPAYAYEGMAVAVIESGSINTLVNKSRIAYPDGWSSSFENVKFITCTQEEFDQWYANTENFQPIDPKLPYIVEDVYYYIYEESMDGDTQLQEYVTAAQLIAIEGRVSKTAEEAAAARKKLSDEIAQDIITSQNELKTYVEQHFVNNDFLEGIDSDGLTGLLSKYYTIESADTTFVKKDELVITESDGSKTYTYLPTSQYVVDQTALNTYKQQIAGELAKTLKANTEGILTVLTVETIKLGAFNITAKEDGVYIGKEKIAYNSNLPKLITLTNEEYKRLEEDNNLDPDVYYMTYNREEEDSLVTANILKNYYSKAQVDDVFAKMQQIINNLSAQLASAQSSISMLIKIHEDKEAFVADYFADLINGEIVEEPTTLTEDELFNKIIGE